MEHDLGESKRAHNVMRGQYALALRLLKDSKINSGAKALDLGAGMGEFASILKDRGLSVTCIDGTPKCVDHIKQLGFESHLVDLETESLPIPDGSLDLVISLEVIEHLWNTDHYLSEIKRVLKPGGYFICTTPNYNSFRYRLYVLFGRFEKFTYKSRHKKFYTARSFPRELAEYFTIEKKLGFGWIPKTGIQFIIKPFQNFLSVHTGILAKKDERNIGGR